MTTKRAPQLPIAKKQTKVTEAHGGKRYDDYFWLQKRDDPEVRAHLEAENQYTEGSLQDTVALQETIFNELKARIKEADTTVPTQDGDYYYYEQTFADKQYRAYYRKLKSLEAPAELLLDCNELAKGHSYFFLGAFAISPDHRYLAYSVDYTGAESFTTYVKDLESGELFSNEIIKETYDDIVWANDSATLYYTRMDATRRPYQVWQHRLGQEPQQDLQLFEEADCAFYVGISKAKSKKYIFFNSHSKTSSEVYYMDADRPSAKPELVTKRRQDVEYHVFHNGEEFYILTNDAAKDFRVMVTPVNNTAKEHWAEFLPARRQTMIDDIELFKDFMAIYKLKEGFNKVEIVHLASKQSHEVSLPDPICEIGQTANPQFNSQTLRFHYSSLTTPKSVYEYDMQKQQLTLRKQDEIPSGYDANNYVSKRVYAEQSDGSKIPISLLYRKDVAKDSNNPLYLHAYGSYGYSTQPAFSSYRLSLLDRGFTFAMAHIRGGGEMGRSWYEQGKLLKKRNSFEDFIACAEHLIQQGYTSRERLCIKGGSAGGLLMGAVVNMRPDLFKAVVASVPFVDVLNTMSDPNLPLTIAEYEEWGNPAKREYYDYIESYSPYDNVAAKAYPHMLVIAGWNDPRVSYWEPAKWVAKLRALKTDNNLLLLKTDMDVGHRGASGRFDYLKEIALEQAFLLKVLGLTK